MIFHRFILKLFLKRVGWGGDQSMKIPQEIWLVILQKVFYATGDISKKAASLSILSRTCWILWSVCRDKNVLGDDPWRRLFLETKSKVYYIMDHDRGLLTGIRIAPDAYELIEGDVWENDQETYHDRVLAMQPRCRFNNTNNTLTVPYRDEIHVIRRIREVEQCFICCYRQYCYYRTARYTSIGLANDSSYKLCRQCVSKPFIHVSPVDESAAFYGGPYAYSYRCLK